MSSAFDETAILSTHGAIYFYRIPFQNDFRCRHDKFVIELAFISDITHSGVIDGCLLNQSNIKRVRLNTDYFGLPCKLMPWIEQVVVTVRYDSRRNAQ